MISIVIIQTMIIAILIYDNRVKSKIKKSTDWLLTQYQKDTKELLDEIKKAKKG